MNLTLEDTLSGGWRTVRPGASGAVALYVCGPTVYDLPHVGHARTYLYFDVARRFLEAEGLTVRHAMNVTDVEDKIDQRAAALGMTSRALARREETVFFHDLGDLGVRAPQFRPRASAFIPDMIRIARALERTGLVRRSGDEWIYEPPERTPGQNFPTGAQLARHAVPEAGHPFPTAGGGDRSILVWKLQPGARPSWSSPWGRGVPGWHLECFAMATRLLGVPVDLHGGGRDLVYPHHYAENEIGLALCRSRFSRTFLHTGLVLQNGAKMSKSTGNLVPLRTALARVGPGALRWYLLRPRYPERLEWSDRDLARSRDEYAGVRRAVRDWLAPGRGGRRSASRAEALAEAVRHDLAQGLRTDHVVPRLARFARELGRESSDRIARGDRGRARRALRTIEARTGIPLL
jgi:cysteinyl-tRNA synthetase